MIDKILTNFSTYLGGYTPEQMSQSHTDALKSYLPTPISYLDIAGVPVPLFGGILAGEMKLLEKLVTLQNDTLAGVSTLLKIIGGDEYTTTPEIQRAVRVGQYQSYLTTVAKVTWTKLGQTELFNAAQKQGVSYFSASISPDGDETVQEIIEKYFDTWIEAGYAPRSGVELANLVLNKQPPVKREAGPLVEFDYEEALKQSGLTWIDIDSLEDLLNPDVPYLLIIKFRTGLGQFNPFDYVPYAQKAGLVEELKRELSSQSVPPPVVASNANVEVDKEGGEQANLK